VSRTKSIWNLGGAFRGRCGNLGIKSVSVPIIPPIVKAGPGGVLIEGDQGRVAGE